MLAGLSEEFSPPHVTNSPVLVLSFLHETLMAHHKSLAEVRGAWTVPLKSKVIFLPSSVGARISLRRFTFLMETTMRVLIK